MTSFRQAVESAADAFVQAEVTRILPNVAGLVPGFPGTLLKMALSSQAVQDGIAKLESEAVSWTLDEAAKGVAAVQGLIASHVHGQLGAVLQAELKKAPPSIPMSAEEAAGVGALVAAGKWPDALQMALKAYGFAQ